MPDNPKPKILFFEPTNPPLGQETASSEATVGISESPADTLAILVRIIRGCGQDPVTQLAGYLITDDPTYLPESAHARAIADHVGRDKLMEALIESYLEGGARTDTSEVRS